MTEREMMNLLQEFVIYYDKSGWVGWCNDAAIKSMGYTDVIHPSFMSAILPDLFHAPDVRYSDGENVGINESDEVYLQDVFMGTGKSVETIMYRRNQTCFPVRLRFYQSADNEFFCIGTDLSESKEAAKKAQRSKEEIQAATQYKNEFVSNITHELRTPVNGMMGLTQGLLDTNLTPSQLETVRIIERCCANMTKIINDLLDFSKMEAGKFTLEEKPFSFRDFINKTMAFNVATINEKGLKLMLRVADDIPTRLIGDELRLTQILNNLINNAVKFTAVGHIAVEISKTMETEDSVELFFMVMDTGIGIAKQDMDKLFKSFSQVDASITRKFGGTGLGLSICKQLVEMMDGSIKVDSEEGKGSTFSFQIVLKKVAEEEAETEEVQFPQGRFVYEGNGRYQEEQNDAEELDNWKEIQNNMEKLLICIELENWEKAENFANIIKNLAPETEQELKKAAFRVELAIRKENKEKSLTQYDALKALVDAS